MTKEDEEYELFVLRNLRDKVITKDQAILLWNAKFGFAITAPQNKELLEYFKGKEKR